MKQTERLLLYLRANPGASSLDIIRDCRIVNTTGRISDLRAQGHVIEAFRVNGVHRYRVIEPSAQLALAL